MRRDLLLIRHAKSAWDDPSLSDTASRLIWLASASRRCRCVNRPAASRSCGVVFAVIGTRCS